MTLLPELFDNLGSISWLESSPKDAFDEIPEIIESIQTKKHTKDSLFLISLGPAGTVLASKISNMGLRAIDIGHISDSYEFHFKDAAWPEKKPIVQSQGKGDT
jgi:hypothetical protein